MDMNAPCTISDNPKMTNKLFTNGEMLQWLSDHFSSLDEIEIMGDDRIIYELWQDHLKLLERIEDLELQKNIVTASATFKMVDYSQRQINTLKKKLGNAKEGLVAVKNALILESGHPISSDELEMQLRPVRKYIDVLLELLFDTPAIAPQHHAK
jgi:hypothetical protein